TVKEALGSDDADRIKQETAALAQIAMKIGEAIYAAQGQAAPEGETGESE
nr:hypothetical protein [Desulfuromonadales bacterium]